MSTDSGPLVVRTWNLFHGNTLPPQRRAFLREMVELVSADEPAVVCLQEVPVWALRRLGAWSGMAVVGVVTARPRLWSAELGRRLTELNHGLLRSAVTGQANAILLARGLRFDTERTLTLSTGGERRVCHSVRVEGLGVIGNFHVTGGASADAQFRLAATFVEAQAGAAVLAGDTNLQPGRSSTYEHLRERGFSEPLPGSIDQILVRGLPSTPPVAWADERRRIGGRLLSDHAPVELTVG